jgi:hypothetical protein
MLQKLSKERAGGVMDVSEFNQYSMAKTLADEALKNLRMANDMRDDPEAADHLAEEGLKKLSSR